MLRQKAGNYTDIDWVVPLVSGLRCFCHLSTRVGCCLLKTQNTCIFCKRHLCSDKGWTSLVVVLCSDRCIEGSATTNATPSEAVYSICTTVIPVNRPSEGRPTVPPGNIIYDDVEMTQRPTSINNTIYANVEPKGEAVDMSKSVVYANLELTTKVQQKPTRAVQNACFSPIYSQPYEPSTIASNTKYAEPFKHRPTAPILDHHAANDQQNIYSLAKAIPLGGPNVIYSEPTKSSAPTATNEAVETTDLIYLNAIEVRQIDENGVECAHAPSAIYAKAAKLK